MQAQSGLHSSLAQPQCRPQAANSMLLGARPALFMGSRQHPTRRVATRVSEVKKGAKKGGLFGGFGSSSAEGSEAQEAGATPPAAATAAQGTAAPSNSPAGAAPPTSRQPSAAAAAAAASPAATPAAVAAEEVATQQASAKLAVAARISAARALARKLAEEKQAAIAAARQVSQQVGDPEAAKQMKEAAEAEVAELARAAARADSVARAAQKAEANAAQQLELQRLKAENEALQELLLQLAADKAAAQQKLAEVQENIFPPKEVQEVAELSHAIEAEATATVEELEREVERESVAKEEEEAERRRRAEEAEAARQAELEAQRQALARQAENELKQMAEKARGEGKAVFACPPTPAKVGALVRIFYDRNRGPLSGGNPRLVFKVGLNKWESIELLPMQYVESLSSVGQWWSVDFVLPEDLYKVDFVVMDDTTGAVDNNGGRDFQLPITGGPTEQELVVRRLAAYEAAEKLRIKELNADEDRIYSEAMAAARLQAEQAREAFRERKRQELLQDAQAAVAERRGKAVAKLQPVASKQGVFAWIGEGASPQGPEAGGTACLVYNKASGALKKAGAVLAHVGYDGWWLKDKRVLRMEKLTPEQVAAYGLLATGDWWGVQVPVWSTAAVLDFVFSDDRQGAWDNGGGFDYHTLVASAPSGERLVELVYAALAESEAEEIARSEEAVAKRVMSKAQTKAAAARKRRERQSRFLYTKPLTPVAGQPVDIYYNPDHTVLNGRPEVYVSGSWNRWNHPNKFKPTPMTPVLKGGMGFLKTTVMVPEDAHVMDLVFLDSSDSHGGFYDSNKGLDYHIPVTGGKGTLPPLRVCHIAVEMAPIAKAGGLGDVVTALGRAVQEEGHDVEVIMPKYDCIDYGQVQDLVVAKDFNWGGTQVKVWKGKVEGLRTVFLEPCNGLFWAGKIYAGVYEDYHRFGFFCGCALEYLKHHSDKKPDILHAHDWQTAPIAFEDRGGPKCAFTIHNLNYGADLIGKAMQAANVCTTVSPTYAQEVSGHPAIAPHLGKFVGIINGIDPDIWDPLEDRFLPRGYDSVSSKEGKAAAKQELRKRMNLSQVDVPIVGCVTRLTHQKGIHLIKHAAWRTMERGGQFVLLGSAPDPKVQAEFEQLAADLGRQYPDRARLWFAYDEPLSHLIYAGSDMFLVPSVFEPCGLTQMIAMRYGAVPVVRRTGGLNDTVFDIDHDQERAAAVGMEPNGFNFEGMDAPGMDYALNRALTRWFEDRQFWAKLVQRVMELDWSWSAPALDYIELYYKALKKAK